MANKYSTKKQDDTISEEKRLYKEYKEKLKELKKLKKEKKTNSPVFTKGLLPIYVLYIISLGPTNGNEISHKIGERTNGKWIPSTGGIYPLLKRLESDGLIEGNWDDADKKFQKRYHLTQKGLKEFESKKMILKLNIEESLDVFNMIYNDLYN